MWGYTEKQRPSCTVVCLSNRVSHSLLWSGYCSKRCVINKGEIQIWTASVCYTAERLWQRYLDVLSHPTSLSYLFVCVCVCVYRMFMVLTLRMKPSGQVSWSYHMALYMSRRSRLVRKAKLMKIRPVIWATNTHVCAYGNEGSFQPVVCVGSLF